MKATQAEYETGKVFVRTRCADFLDALDLAEYLEEHADERIKNLRINRRGEGRGRQRASLTLVVETERIPALVEETFSELKRSWVAGHETRSKSDL